jgi:hypothetical protein
MTSRTTNRTVVFRHPFELDGVDRVLPPGDYRVATDEELIEGTSFPVYRRVSTVIFVPGDRPGDTEMVQIDPGDLKAAWRKDTAA